VKDRERSPNAFASKSVWTSQPFVDTWQWDRAVYVTADWRRSVNHRQSAYGKLPQAAATRGRKTFTKAFIATENHLSSFWRY